MITEKDLQEAIAECEGVRNPTSTTCLKLAAYYTIQDKMFGDNREEKIVSSAPEYSFAKEPEKTVEKTISYQSDTEFSQAIYGRNEYDILSIVDELMSVLQTINPRLYNGVMRKIES